MKIIAVEEHCVTHKYLDYLHSRKEYPRREYVIEGGKKFVRDWWSPTNFRLFDVGKPHKIMSSIEDRISDMYMAGIDMQVLSLSFPGVERYRKRG